MTTKTTTATISATLAAGFAAALFGLAAPASADTDHLGWVQDIQQHASSSRPTSVVGDGR